MLYYDKADRIIRLARIGGIWPISQSGSPIASVTISGYKFDLYYGLNGAMKVYSFLPPQGTTYNSFNADIKNFYKYLTQSQGFPQSTQNLIGMTTL
jgi:xyloglucan-specific endo-beta-1,4-glucanase